MTSVAETPSLLKRIILNPIAIRELRVACRGWKLMVILTSYLLVQGSIMAIWMSTQYNSQLGTYDTPTDIGSGLFITMSIILVCVVMLVFPAFSSTAIAAEHERKSFDLLMLTPLSPWEIAQGKFIAAGVQASIFLVATIPLFALANIFGGIDPAVFFMTLWILVLLSLLISFIGVYASSLVTKAIPAVLVTYSFAIALGVVLIIAFSALMFAAKMPAVRMGFPIVSMFVDPTVSEGIYYAVGFGLTAAIYCSYFFLSTTNRLKPLSHNKSTSMRIYWTVAMIAMPCLFGAYFLSTRLPTPGSATGTLIVATIYIAMALLVPALTFPAESPIPSRRVRREIEKLPKGLMAAGGIMFMPGSARGASHTGFLVALGFGMMLLAGSICYSQLNGKLDDPLEARKRAQELMMSAGAGVSAPSPGGLTPAPVSAVAAPSIVKLGFASERELVERYNAQEHMGFVWLVAVLAATVLAISQITWRISLSGLSKSIAGLLAGLIIASWVVVPIIVESAMSRSVSEEDRTVAQFSPVWGGMNAWSYGKSNALQLCTLSGSADHLRHDQRADSFQTRLITYLATTSLIGLGLLVSNIFSHRRIMRLVEKAQAQSQSQMPILYTQQPPAPQAQPWAEPQVAAGPPVPMQSAPAQQPVAPPPAQAAESPPAPPAT